MPEQMTLGVGPQHAILPHQKRWLHVKSQGECKPGSLRKAAIFSRCLLSHSVTEASSNDTQSNMSWTLCAHQQGLAPIPGTHHAGETVVTEALSHLGQRVGREGGYNKNVSPLAQLDVLHRVAPGLPGTPLFLIACQPS